MKDSKIRLSFGNLIYLSSICGSERARYLLEKIKREGVVSQTIFYW